MANELQALYTTGKNVRAIISNAVGQIWQTTTSTFVSYATANRANYLVALTEQGTASGRYYGTFPAGITALGLYKVALYADTVAGSPAETDSYVGGGSIEWDGSAPCAMASRQATLLGLTARDGQVIRGTATAGAASTITLAAAPAYTLLGWWITTTGGTGPSQSRQIFTHTAGSAVVTVSPAWATTPASGTTYIIEPQAPVNVGLWLDGQPNTLNSGRVRVDVTMIGGGSSAPYSIGYAFDGGIQTLNPQAVGSSTLTLHSSASSIDNQYRDWILTIVSGTGSGQRRRISSYVGATKVATVDKAWVTTPNTSSGYSLCPFVAGDVSTWLSSSPNALTGAGNLQTDLQTIKGQAVTAAAAVTFPATIGSSTLAAGAQMDLVNAPNATAVTAIQAGLSKPGTAQTITPPGTMATLANQQALLARPQLTPRVGTPGDNPLPSAGSIGNTFAAGRFVEFCRTQRVAVGIVADSNNNQADLTGPFAGKNTGWTDASARSLADALGAAGTTVSTFPAGIQGFSGAAFSNGYSSDDAPAFLKAKFMPLTIPDGAGTSTVGAGFGYNFGCYYVPPGGTVASDNGATLAAQLARDATNHYPTDTRAAITAYMRVATFATGPGNATYSPQLRSNVEDDESFTTINPVTGTDGFIDVEISITANASRTVPLTAYAHRLNNLGIVGPCAVLNCQFALTDATTGVTVGVYQTQGGMGAVEAATSVMNATDEAMVEYQRGFVVPQIAIDQDPVLGIAFIHGGNDELDGGQASFDPTTGLRTGPDSNTKQGYKNNVLTHILRDRAAWMLGGRDEDRLFHILYAYHPREGHEAIQAEFQQANEEIALLFPRTVFTGRTLAGLTAQRMADLGYYRESPAHLSYSGFYALDALKTEALLAATSARDNALNADDIDQIVTALDVPTVAEITEDIEREGGKADETYNNVIVARDFATANPDPLATQATAEAARVAAVAAKTAGEAVDGRLPPEPAARGDVQQAPAPGAGADPLTWTLQVDGLPLIDADVWLTTTTNPVTQVVDRKRTGTDGVVKFLADKYQVDGTTLNTFYGWAQKNGVQSIGPETLTCD